MIHFLMNNYETIISCVFALFSFIIGIISAVRSKRSKAAVYIISQIPELCSEIESLFPNGFGSVKFGFVIRQIEKLCSLYGVSFDRQFYTEQVERVLSAPCSNDKKGG